MGNLDAPVKIVEFSDLECPACGASYPILLQILQEFRDNVSYEYWHFPLSYHPNGEKAAEAAECANDQGKFYEFIDIAFRNQNNLKVNDLKQYAAQLNLDTEKFNACLDSGTKKDDVRLEQREGLNKGVDGTPTFFINDKKLDSWKYEVFKQAILDELNQ